MTTRWTELDLERFHDDAMPADERAGLADDLRRDADLRARLGAVIALDHRARAALTVEPQAPLTTLRIRPAARIAAVLAVLSTGAIAWFSLVPMRVPVSPEAVANAEMRLLNEARAGGLLIAVVTDAPPVIAPEAPPASPSDRVLAMLDADDLSGAVAAIHTNADAASAAAMWRAVGERLRTGQAAEDVLASVDPETQIEACRAWAAHPTLRPVTFEWLARLGASTDPDIRAAVASLRAEFASRPELQSWLRSYAAARPGAPNTP